MNLPTPKFLLGLLTIFLLQQQIFADSIQLFFDADVPQVKFAADDLVKALEKKNHSVVTKKLDDFSALKEGKAIVLTLTSDRKFTDEIKTLGDPPSAKMQEQSFSIRTQQKDSQIYWVIGADAVGLMYGGLDLAEHFVAHDWGKSLTKDESPYLKNRGMKLNLPLDRRIPTYVGGWSSDSAKFAIPHVWDIDFWKKLIDHQARHRYNVLSVWVHHPFPALVKLPDYPTVCLPNIEGFDGFKKNLTHENRVAFWREVMTYAHSRGMKFYFFNWNIHLEHASEMEPSLKEDPKCKETIDYMYKSMQALIDTYPELDGFGITSGDGMDGTKQENTQWTWEAMGKAAHDYLKAHPERKFNLIHRGVKSNPETCDEIYAPIKKLPNVTFNMSAKYAMAHMYSTPTPKWSNDIQECKKRGLKTWLTFRNDDFFYLHWGDPKFVREFIHGIPEVDTVEGMYIGIDGYNPSRAYCHVDETFNGQLEMERRWFMEMLWGRISYNPAISDEVFQNLLAQKYPTTSGKALLDAWSLSSRSLPRVTELIMQGWQLDFHWYPEGCWSDPNRCTGFRTIDGFANETDVAKGSNLCNIGDSAAGKCNGKKSSYEVADEISENTKAAFAALNQISPNGNKELELAVQNIKQMAYLSTYYSYKIRGATYKKAGKIDEARAQMAEAYGWWLRYTRSMQATYHPQSFRNLAIAPDWQYADAAALKEYTDLGGKGLPSCANMFPLELEAKKGSVAVSPAGKLYDAGSKITVTANPDFGYAFDHWDGDISGKQNPMDLVMDGGKSLRANFKESTSDALPWLESFDQANGTRSHGSPRSWKSKRLGGNFEVHGGQWVINGPGGDGELESAEIDISQRPVTARLRISSNGNVDSGDSVKFYIIVDGGKPKLVEKEIKGKTDGFVSIEEQQIKGKILKMRIVASVSSKDEFYFLDNWEVK